MKILVIGSGGRERALAWKLAKSKKVEKIYAAPGNGGTAGEEKTENLSLDGAECESEKGQKILLDFARKEKIDLTIVGPEAPLAAGISDRFRPEGLAIIGPGRDAARLESSKAYSKSFMEKYGVRTAGNIDDRNADVIDVLYRELSGKLFGDRGYISQELFERLYHQGIRLITRLRKNMKNKLMDMKDKLLLRKRAVIEPVNDFLKNICQAEHSRHRSINNFLVNVLAALSAYSFLPHKPSIHGLDEQMALLMLA